MKKVVKVKTGKKKSEPSVKTLVSAAVAQIAIAATETKAAFEVLSRVLVEIKAAAKAKKAGTVSQATLFCGARLYEIEKLAKSQREEYRMVMAEHKDAGGEFEAGKIAITIDVSEKTNPKWKEAAIAAAKRLAEVEGVPFDEVRYIKRIQDEYESSKVTSVQIVESD